MDLQRITGLTSEQLTDLTARVHHRLGLLAHPGGRPAALGLYRSISLVVALHRHNLTQNLAGAIFDVSQATVSRRWDLLRPLIAAELTALIPDPAQITGTSTILVDGQRHEIPCVEADRVTDPTGCGDAYRAGLLYGISHGWDWASTGKLGSVMGAIKIAHRGGQNHAPAREEIEARFKRAFGYSPWKG